jgi:hypothetical protein
MSIHRCARRDRDRPLHVIDDLAACHVDEDRIALLGCALMSSTSQRSGRILFRRPTSAQSRNASPKKSCPGRALGLVGAIHRPRPSRKEVLERSKKPSRRVGSSQITGIHATRFGMAAFPPRDHKFESALLQQAVCLSGKRRGCTGKAPHFGGILRAAGDVRRDAQAANRASFALSL